MRFAEPLQSRRSFDQGKKVLKDTLETVGKILCLVVAMGTSFGMMEIFYPNKSSLRITYLLLGILLVSVAIIWILAKNTFLLLAYFCGMFAFCQFLKMTFTPVGELPEWRWFFLSLLYAIFFWIAHEIGKYSYSESR